MKALGSMYGSSVYIGGCRLYTINSGILGLQAAPISMYVPYGCLDTVGAAESVRVSLAPCSYIWYIDGP